MRLSIMLIVMYAMFLSGVNAAELLLDPASPNTPQLWTPEYGGQWGVGDDGVIEGTRRPIWAGDKNWTNYRLTLDAMMTGDGVDEQIWISFRYHDEWNRYAIALRDGELNDLFLCRYRKADIPQPDLEIENCYPLEFEPENNRWIPIRIEVRGNHIQAWAGDAEEPQVDYYDLSPIENGTIALGGSWHINRFRNVRVEALPPENETIATGLPEFVPEAQKYNFGTSDMAPIDGFTLADGSAYEASRGHGWDKDYSASTRVRSSNAQPELDSLLSVAHGMNQATFRLDLPDGDYFVSVVGGDPSYASHFEAEINGKHLGEIELNLNKFDSLGGRIQIKGEPLLLKLLSDHPASDAGLSASYLVVEPWEKVEGREIARMEKKLAEEKLQKTIAAKKQSLRQAQRTQYQPLAINVNENKPRQTHSLTGDWLFMPGQDLAEGDEPANPQTSDQTWHTLDVPNFWNQIGWWIYTGNPREVSESYRHRETERTDGYTFDARKTQAGWYRHWLEFPAKPATAKRVVLHFQAVASSATFFFNGKSVGSHIGMFAPFDIDVTEQVRWGEPNLLAVHVVAKSSAKMDDDVQGIAVSMELTGDMLNALPKGIYTPVTDLRGKRAADRQGGIWQPVTLEITQPAYIDDVYFQPHLDGAKIDIVLDSTSQEPFDGEVIAEIAGVTLSQQGTYGKGQNNKISFDFKADNLKLWSPEAPNLYPLEVTLKSNGKAIDTWTREVGFRTIEVRGERFYLNGKPYFIRGANMPPHGLVPNDRALARTFFQYMKDGNQYALRAVCSPLPKVWLEEADRAGVLVSMEGTWPWMMFGDKPIPDTGLIETWRREMHDLVRDMRNHPSIFMWTMNNEMYFWGAGYESEKESERIEKWQIMSDMIGEMRAMHPSTIICMDSGYRPNQKVLDLVKEHNFDDGDICDPHFYFGYGAPSVKTDAVYNGGYFDLHIPDPVGMPIMSQEASTGYPNNDTGHFERSYLGIYTSQTWAGDDAYDHRDPAPWLKYHAHITKEWIEDVRRTRRTAGWIVFCNACWFKHVTNADLIEPWPTYYSAKLALSDVLVSFDQRNRHYFAGDRVQARIHVINDAGDANNLNDLILTVQLESPEGTALMNEPFAMPDCAYYSNAIQPIAFDLPAKLPQARGNYTLRLTLKSGSRQVSENTYELLLATKQWSQVQVKPTRRFLIMGEARQMRQALTDINAQVLDDPASLTPDDIAILASASVPSRDSAEGRQLLDFVRKGGTLLLVETSNAQDLLPEGLVLSTGSFEGEFVNQHSENHPLFAGFESQDLKWWNGLDGKAPLILRTAYELAKDDRLTLVGDFIEPHGYGWQGPRRWGLFEVAEGKGRILVSELRTEACLIDPLAGRFLSNLVNWASQTENN